jgi:hypothetical protein
MIYYEFSFIYKEVFNLQDLLSFISYILQRYRFQLKHTLNMLSTYMTVWFLHFKVKLSMIMRIQHTLSYLYVVNICIDTKLNSTIETYTTVTTLHQHSITWFVVTYKALVARTFIRLTKSFFLYRFRWFNRCGLLIHLFN